MNGVNQFPAHPRYSPIAPVQLLHELMLMDHKNYDPESTERALGDYLLVLAHDVLEHPREYEVVMDGVRNRWGTDETFIMVDNGVIELGNALTVGDVIEAAEIVHADVIMTPDVLRDKDATIALINNQMLELIRCKFPLMWIPQGATHQELCSCVDYFRISTLARSPIEYWGIPRWIGSELETRANLIYYIQSTAPSDTEVRIHLLGMSKNLQDDLRCLELPDVIGIDSANPLVLGSNGYNLQELVEYDQSIHMDRDDYWYTRWLSDTMLENVRFMHEYCVDVSGS